MVFAGLYPMDQSLHMEMKSALERLTLNDSAVSITSESRYKCLKIDSNIFSENNL